MRQTNQGRYLFFNNIVKDVKTCCTFLLVSSIQKTNTWQINFSTLLCNKLHYLILLLIPTGYHFVLEKQKKWKEALFEPLTVFVESSVQDLKCVSHHGELSTTIWVLDNFLSLHSRLLNCVETTSMLQETSTKADPALPAHGRRCPTGVLLVFNPDSRLLQDSGKRSKGIAQHMLLCFHHIHGATARDCSSRTNQGSLSSHF